MQHIRAQQQIIEWQEDYIDEMEIAYDDYAYKHGDGKPQYPPIKPMKGIWDFR